MKGTLMSETPIYDALMEEYNSRRGHVNPLMEQRVDAKTLRKNIALKKEDEEPEYTKTSTGEALTPTYNVKFIGEKDCNPILLEDNIHRLDLEKGMTTEKMLKIIQQNPGYLITSLESKMELDGTTTVIFRGGPSQKDNDETQPMDFRGYFEKKEGE